MKIGLFSRFKSAAQPSFEELLAPHVEQLYRLAFRYCGTQHDAEDLVQDLLVKLYPKHQELLLLDKLGPWLVRSLYHLYIDAYRRQRRSPLEYGMDESLEVSADLDRPDYQLEYTELQREIQAALDKMSEEHRILLIMHDIEAYSLPELEGILEVPIGTLKSRLHRGRNRLKDLLKKGTINEGQALFIMQGAR
ncbi:MAG: RNA polymerase sigma factor [Pseudomonadota bacterium]